MTKKAQPLHTTTVDTSADVVKNHQIVGGVMSWESGENKGQAKFGIFFIGSDPDAPQHRSHMYTFVCFDETKVPEGKERYSSGNKALSNSYPCAPSKQRLIEQMQEQETENSPFSFEFKIFEDNASLVTWMLEK